MHNRMPEWKRKMFESADRCREKIKALKAKGVAPSKDRIAYQQGKGYFCPVCGGQLYFDHDPHGKWNDACVNPDCDYYHLSYAAVD